MSDPGPTRASDSPNSNDGRLDSWKEIAAYLKRDVRTVHRWEADEGLPVHRHIHKKRATVYAYKTELEAWWNARKPRVEEEKPAPAARPRRMYLIAVAVVVLLMTCAVIYLARNRVWSKEPLSTGKMVLVVLPFENPGGNPEEEYFSDGLTEEMTIRLASLQPERLAVIARTSAMQYKRSGKGIQQIAQELGVDYLLESSVRRSGSRVRITTQLIQARDQTHVWTDTYEREIHDVLKLQADVAAAIANQVALRLTPTQQRNLTAQGTVNPQAHEAYLKGLFFWNKFTQEGMKKSIEYFEQAIALEPGYAQPYARMARAYGVLGNFGALRPEQAYPKQKAAAQKALQLDGTLDEAHSAIGWTAVFYERDWTQARNEFQRAVEINPNSATAHQGLAMYFIAMGQFDQSHSEILRAQELDPVSLNIKADVGWFLFFARRTNESIAQLRTVLEMDPNFSMAHVFLASAYQQNGMHKESLEASEAAIRHFDKSNIRTALLGYAYAVAGKKDEARKVLEEVKDSSKVHYVPPYTTALIYTALGQRDDAFVWLEKAYQDRSWMMAFLKVDPRLDALRSDSRFTDLMQRMKFPS